VTGGAGLLASYVIPWRSSVASGCSRTRPPEDETLVRGFGADVVLPRGDALVAAIHTSPDGVDAVYDTALLATGDVPRDPRGRGVRRGQEPGTARTSSRASGSRRVQVWTALERTDWLWEVRELAERGVLVPRVAETIPAGGGGEAQRRMEAGGLRGRAVIVF
jgi:D-arabinose 1-dehydrogenase-like Zn-dependent alcohol dehydrogenase